MRSVMKWYGHGEMMETATVIIIIYYGTDVSGKEGIKI